MMAVNKTDPASAANIVSAIQSAEISGSSAGNVYAALARLQAKGFVKAEWKREKDRAGHDGRVLRKARLFIVTAKGNLALEDMRTIRQRMEKAA